MRSKRLTKTSKESEDAFLYASEMSPGLVKM